MSAHNILRELHMAPCEVCDPGTGNPIPVDRWNQIVPIVTGGVGETNTLPNPTQAGQRLGLICKTHGGGDRVVTAASAINQAGNTTMTFGVATDLIIVESYPVGTGYRWRVVANDNVALA